MVSRQWSDIEQEKKEMFDWLSKLFLTKTRDEWWEWGRDKGMMFGPVLNLEESLNDPQLIHRQMVLELTHPSLGKVVQIGSPFKLSDTPP